MIRENASDSMLCLLPPLDDQDDAGFWLTPLDFPRMGGFKLYAVFGLGTPPERAFLLVKTADGKKDVAAFSICELPPDRIWGKRFAKERNVRWFIHRFHDDLLDHWRGLNSSMELSRATDWRNMRRFPYGGLWTLRLWGRKTLEIQHIKMAKDESRNVGIFLGMNFRTDHAGFYCDFLCWNHELAIHVYDGRHWCHEHDCWYDEEKHPYHDGEE